MTFDWKIIIIVIILLVVADKLITVANINAVKKNFPDKDPLSIEKNLIAREFFKQQGLLWGTIFFSIFSILCFLLAMFLLNWTLKLFGVSNSLSIAFYIIIIIYGITIFNNLYFLLKYSKVIT